MGTAPQPQRRPAAAGLLALTGLIALCVHAATSGVRPNAAGRTAGAMPAPSAAAAPLSADTGTAHAAAMAAPAPGTRDTVLAGPHVPRPSGTPCTVELFRDVEIPIAHFTSWDGHGRFAYAPPPACPEPWAKVILKVALRNADPDSYLDGVEFAYVSIGDVPLYSGAAADNDVPTHWRVERDVTDYAVVLRTPNEGAMEIQALPRFGGVFHAPYYMSATLLFYPANTANRAPRVPDAAYPLAPDHGWREVGGRAGSLAATLSLPRNVERAYLDVMAHPRAHDVLWFTCMPNAAIAAFPELRSPLAIGTGQFGLEGEPPPQGCGEGGFREVQVSIDGQPAGVVPVFPRFPPKFNALWNTPALLQPAPPPQALNFMPYRVDLTPFAGLLSDGAPHVVALSVAGRESEARFSDFQLSGTLLVYRDRGGARVTGQVTRNTLAGQPPAPNVSSTLARDAAGVVSGSVVTRSTRSYAIEGYVDTSRGRIRSTVERSVRFENVLVPEAYDGPGDAADRYSLGVGLASSVSGTSRRYLAGKLIAEDREYIAYPLTLAYRYRGARLQQAYVQRTERWRPGVTRYYTHLLHEVDLAYVPGDAGAPALEWRGDQRYLFRDSYASCYRTDVRTQGGALAEFREGTDCPGGVNRLFWAAHPDGSPDGLGWAK